MNTIAHTPLGQPLICRFAPHQTPPLVLNSISVNTHSLLTNLQEQITASIPSRSTHHVLIHGPQGCGKSHTLTLLWHNLHSSPQTADKLQIAWLHEEQTITSLPQLLLTIYQSLGLHYPQDYSQEWLRELLEQAPSDVAEILTRRLAARFTDRRLVLFIENLDRLLTGLGSHGRKQLRALLQEQPFACLIATTRQLFHAVTDRDQPFFGFFQTIEIPPLSPQNIRRLLAAVAHTCHKPALAQAVLAPTFLSSINTLHQLTNGNPRACITFATHLTDTTPDHVSAAISSTIDDLTPTCLQPLRELSPLQRQIMQLICEHPTAINPKEIACRLLSEQGSVGKQIRLLAESGLLTSRQRGRETWYEIKDTLLRLACQHCTPGQTQDLLHFLLHWNQSLLLRPINTPDAPAPGNTRTPLPMLLEEIIPPCHIPRDPAEQFAAIFLLHEQLDTMQDAIRQLLALSQPLNSTRLLLLAVGLLKSLPSLQLRRFAPDRLRDCATAVALQMAQFPQCRIAVRLFQTGIRCIISGNHSEFVTLVQLERNILRQALNLASPDDSQYLIPPSEFLPAPAPPAPAPTAPAPDADDDHAG